MGRLSIIISVVGVLLLGSVSVAQQHELPWGDPEASPAVAIAAAPTASAAAAAVTRVDVGSPWPSRGAASVVTAPSTCAGAADADCATRRWSPQVVPLTVDPWTKPAPARPTWAPKPGDVVDPWGAADRAPEPPPAAPPAAAVSPQVARSTIF